MPAQVYCGSPFQELPDGSLQGYSAVLGLNLRRELGTLGWHDPDTGRHIVTMTDERARADRAEADLIAAQTRIAELEERLRSQNT